MFQGVWVQDWSRDNAQVPIQCFGRAFGKLRSFPIKDIKVYTTLVTQRFHRVVRIYSTGVGWVQNKLNETPSAGHAACKICVSTAKYQDKHYTSPNPLPNSRHWDTIYFLIFFILFIFFDSTEFIHSFWWFESLYPTHPGDFLTGAFDGNFREWSQSSLVIIPFPHFHPFPEGLTRSRSWQRLQR